MELEAVGTKMTTARKPGPAPNARANQLPPRHFIIVKQRKITEAYTERIRKVPGKLKTNFWMRVVLTAQKLADAIGPVDIVNT